MSVELGPLPEPTAKGSTGYGRLWSTLYTADQMRAYAAQEVARERERCAIVGGAAADAGMDGAGVAATIRDGPNVRAHSRSAIDRSASR